MTHKLNPYNLPENVQKAIVSGKVVPLFNWNKRKLITLKSMVNLLKEDRYIKVNNEQDKELTEKYIKILQHLILKKEVIQCSLKPMNEKLS